ncbi:hypothetical protein KDA14_06315, partial [Candidatus Saccharibacteria bacterium]|nr:hypothetical protein [Candidatus Saccharibacteria bacterium]
VEGAKEGGCPVVGTGRINKPMTALLLQHEGFVPQSQDSVAEILEADPQQVPVVRWLHNVRGARSTIQGSDHYGPFYAVEGPAIVRGYEEPINSDNVVVLHTTFDR